MNKRQVKKIRRLKLKYICPVCNDTGYDINEFCHCPAGLYEALGEYGRKEWGINDPKKREGWLKIRKIQDTDDARAERTKRAEFLKSIGYKEK